MRTTFLFISIITVLFFQACATKGVEEKPHIVFPKYPLQPKIAYLDTYRGGTSINMTNTFDMLLGTDNNMKHTANMVKPYGVGIGNGNYYIADPGSNSVFIINMKTKELSHLGIGFQGKLKSPVAIALDASGTVYVTDSKQKTVQGYDKNGKFVYIHGGRMEFSHPTGLAIDKDLNRMYVVDTKKHHFKAFDIATKKLLFTVGKRGKGDAEFNFPTNITVDQRNGNILVADTQNFRVQIFDKEGNFINRFGEVGDRPGMFARPKGIAVDSEGHVYVTDAAFNNVQIFNQEGQVMLWFGEGGFSEARFRSVTGIAIDENDLIAVADGFTGRLQTFQYLSDNWIKNNPKKNQEYLDYKPAKEELGPSLDDGK